MGKSRFLTRNRWSRYGKCRISKAMKMIRRAIIAVVIALAAGPVARGELWITVNGVADPPDPGLCLEPNETAVVRVHSANECAVWTNIIVLEGPGSVNLAGMSIIDLAVDYDSIVDVTDDPDFREWLASIGYADPFAITYSELVSVIGACFPIPSGVMIDGIILRGEAEGDITISLLDGGDGTLLDRQVVHVGDKPVPILRQGLVAHWELDEAEGLIAHDSAGDSNGIIYGAAWASGQIGQALDFNGIDDYVDFGNDESLNLGAGEFSISAWINPRSFGSDEPRPIISKWQDDANRWYLHTYNDCVEFTSKGQGSIVYVAGTEGLLDLDRWHHVCFVAEGKGKMYVDGEDRTNWATHPPLIGSLDNSAAVKLGSKGSTETPTYFDGSIDDVRIYERTLSPGEVRRLYDVGVAGGGVIYVDGPNGSDNNDGLTRDTAFATIQKGIYSAWPGETVIVADGTYTGMGNKNLDFWGRAITVKSADGPHATIIDCQASGRGFYFHRGEVAGAIVEGFTLTGGSASQGGGIYISYACPTIKNCIISRNYASSSGGMGGGGLYCTNSAAQLINCLFEGNVTPGDGGGMFNYRSLPKIANCTFVTNQGDDGCAAFSLYSDVTMVNTITWGNTGGAGNFIAVVGSTLRLGNCDIERGLGYIWNPRGTVVDNGGNIDADPLFVDPCNGDYRLLPDSPCIDAGTNDAAYLPDTDLAGRARIVDGDCDGVAIVDMGAYEFRPADVGDMDSDCDVDLPDLSILAPGWQSEEGDAEFRQEHDINWPPDGRINWRDILVLSDNWLMAFGP